MEKNQRLLLVLSQFQLFNQKLNKRRIKQRNHQFNFDGGQLLIAILSLWKKDGYWSNVKIAQYFGIPWRMWVYIKQQMVELFQFNFKAKPPFNKEEILVIIVFYLILKIKQVSDNSYKTCLFSPRFDQIISNYLDLNQFKFYFNKAQDSVTDLWTSVKTTIETIVCENDLNNQESKVLLLDLITWFETRLLSYENYFNTKNQRFKKYQKLLSSFSNFIFLTQIYDCYHDWHFSLKSWIQKEWRPLFKPKIADFTNQVCFKQQYQPQKILKIFYLYLIQYFLKRLKKEIVVVHDLVPNQKEMMVYNLLEVFAQSQITEMTFNHYQQTNDYDLSQADLVIMFTTEKPVKTTKNMIWINEKNSFVNRSIVNLELCCKAIYFFIEQED